MHEAAGCMHKSTRIHSTRTNFSTIDNGKTFSNSIVRDASFWVQDDCLAAVAEPASHSVDHGILLSEPERLSSSAYAALEH